MPISWNEIRQNAIAFSKRWANESRKFCPEGNDLLFFAALSYFPALLRCSFPAAVISQTPRGLFFFSSPSSTIVFLAH